MDLKSTIDNTNKYKNDLKLAKQKINDKILSGGGTIADTISDVPSAIDGLLGNYKKIAMGNLKKKIFLNHNQSIRFELPIDFKYTFIFIKVCEESVETDGQMRPDIFGTITNSMGNTQAATPHNEVEVRRVGDKGVEIIGKSFFDSQRYNKMYLEDWIAIG